MQNIGNLGHHLVNVLTLVNENSFLALCGTLGSHLSREPRGKPFVPGPLAACQGTLAHSFWLYTLLLVPIWSPGSPRHRSLLIEALEEKREEREGFIMLYRAMRSEKAL